MKTSLAEREQRARRQAEAAVDRADDAALKLMLNLALDNVKAQHAGALALIQRCTQALAFALAAATGSMASRASVQSTLATASSSAFIAAATVCLWAIVSDQGYLPGIEPRWWGHKFKETDEIRETAAYRKAICSLQDDFLYNWRRNRVRAMKLNVCLALACSGVVLFLGALWR